MEKENKLKNMEINMKENIKMIKLMEKESIPIKMDHIMKENLLTEHIVAFYERKWN